MCWEEARELGNLAKISASNGAHHGLQKLAWNPLLPSLNHVQNTSRKSLKVRPSGSTHNHPVILSVPWDPVCFPGWDIANGVEHLPSVGVLGSISITTTAQSPETLLVWFGNH